MKTSTVLSAEQIAEIRSTYAAGDVSQRQLANKYSVSQTLISRLTGNQERILKTSTCKCCGKVFTADHERPYCSHPCYAASKPSRPLAERFWCHVKQGPPDSCWLWQGAKHQYGYGKMGTGTRGNRFTTEAHRVSWELHNGPIPEGMHVCHSCDNPPCVNPAHLFLGSNADNRQDSVAKGRHAHGPRLPQSKLTEEKVREMRLLYATGKETYKSLASRYNVSFRTIADVFQGKTWSHVT